MKEQKKGFGIWKVEILCGGARPGSAHGSPLGLDSGIVPGSALGDRGRGAGLSGAGHVHASALPGPELNGFRFPCSSVRTEHCSFLFSAVYVFLFGGDTPDCALKASGPFAHDPYPSVPAVPGRRGCRPLSVGPRVSSPALGCFWSPGCLRVVLGCMRHWGLSQALTGDENTTLNWCLSCVNVFKVRAIKICFVATPGGVQALLTSVLRRHCW